MHGGERGTEAPCTQLSTRKLLRIFTLFIQLPLLTVPASLTDHTPLKVKLHKLMHPQT